MVNVKLLEHLKQIRETLVQIDLINNEIVGIDQTFTQVLNDERKKVFSKVYEIDAELEASSNDLKAQYSEDKAKLIDSIEQHLMKAKKIETKEMPVIFTYMIKGLKKIQYKPFKMYPRTVLEWGMFLGAFLLIGYIVGIFSDIWKYSIWGISFLGMPALQIANTSFYRERRLKIHPRYKNVKDQIELLNQNLEIMDQEIESKINEIKLSYEVERTEEILKAQTEFEEIAGKVSEGFQKKKSEKESELYALVKWLKNPQESEIINPDFHSLKTMDLFIKLVENQQAHSVKELMDRYEGLVRDEEARALEKMRQQELIELAKQKEARLISIEEEKLKVEKERYAAEIALKNLKEELEKINIYERELAQMIEGCHTEIKKIKEENLEESKQEKKLKPVYKKIEMYESKLEESREKKHRLLLSSDGEMKKE